LLSTEGVAPDKSVMIGDRRHDIEAAKVNGTQSIGVSYGYGSDEELSAAAPDGYAATPADITAAIDLLGR
ncbi:MAG: HAD hydrolase-like protein, partial [Proteobacteria bacterium]|nr:HAD hydrolase-like protein [Pseudomonadota bacterium]